MEMQKGLRVGLEDILNGVSGMDTRSLEKLAETVSHILEGRRDTSPAERERALMGRIHHLIPVFISDRYRQLQEKMEREKISATEHREFMQIVAYLEEMAVVRLQLMAELAGIRQVSLSEVAENLRKQRYSRHVKA
jgi:hypothetical protein